MGRHNEKRIGGAINFVSKLLHFKFDRLFGQNILYLLIVSIIILILLQIKKKKKRFDIIQISVYWVF